MIDLSNKVALITGGSRGIGKACVEYFAKVNSKVAFTYKSAKNSAEKLEKEFLDRVRAYRVDMESEKEIFDMVDNVASAMKREAEIKSKKSHVYIQRLISTGERPE